MVYLKIYLIKSKIILQCKKCLFNLRNNFFLIAIGLLIYLLLIDKFLESLYLIPVFVFYLFYIYKKDKNCFFSLFSIVIIYSFSFIINCIILNTNKNSENQVEVSGIVIDIKEYDDYNKLTIRDGFVKRVVYDSSKLNISISDKINVYGYPKEMPSERIEFGFNQQEYYYGLKVKNVISSKDIIIKKSINIYSLRYLIYKYCDFFFQEDIAKAYVKALVIGDNSDLYDEDKENIQINGISHLFAISGLHITLLVGMVSSLLLSFKISSDNVKKIITIILVFYMLITNLNVSVCRASLLYILSNLNKKYNLKLSSLDIISILFIAFVIINPSYVYNLSFKLSFLASFFIILFSSVLRNLKEQYRLSSMFEILILTFFVQIITLPIVVNLNNSFNLLSCVTNVLFIMLVTYIILPFTFATFLLPILQYVYKFLINSFIFLNSFCSTFFTINIDLPSFSKIELILFYLFLILFCMFFKYKNKKKIYFYISLIIYFLSYYNKANLNINGEVNFLDMYDGDCTVINLPMKKGIVVVDTGSGKNSALTKYLKSHGIRTIDVLILTHNHDDHNGEAKEVINQFNVNKIVVSAYDNSGIGYATKVLAGDVIELNGYKFEVLSPVIDTNANDNSIVIYTKLGNYKYLFLGDASKSIEESLIKYNLDCDVIKVGHHGSKTSTSSDFYRAVNPKYVIIETGQIKLYGFPHDEVIEVLSDYSIYRTDINYSIKIKFNKKKSIISSLK